MPVGRNTPLITATLIAGILIGVAAAYLTPIAPLQAKTVTLNSTTVVTRTVAITEMAQATTKTEIVTVTLRELTTKTFSPLPQVPLRLEVKYSRQFEVLLINGYKVVKDALNRTLILVPRGFQPPKDLEGTVVYTPVERVALMSATQVALIERLKEKEPQILERVAGIMWGEQYEWYFSDLEERLMSGKIKDLGPDYSPSIEELVALKPDLVIIYTFPGSDFPQRLEELGIPFVVDNEYLETSPLARFEWIKLIATFFDLDEEAFSIFRDVENRVSEVVGDVETSGATSPLVCWFMVYRGVVYAAGGKSFPANALNMLRARYAFTDAGSTGSVTVNIEEVLNRCKDADVVVYPTSFVSGVSDILSEAPELGELKAFKERRVYAYAPSVFQLGYYDTEGWVKDLASILYPNLYPGYEPKYFVRLGG